MATDHNWIWYWNQSRSGFNASRLTNPLLLVDGDTSHTLHADHGGCTRCHWQQQACHEHHWSYCILLLAVASANLIRPIILNSCIHNADNLSQCLVSNRFRLFADLLWISRRYVYTVWYHCWFCITAVQRSNNSGNFLGMLKQLWNLIIFLPRVHNYVLLFLHAHIHTGPLGCTHMCITFLWTWRRSCHWIGSRFRKKFQNTKYHKL